nr:ribosomal protein L22 [Allium hookeri var. muliense]
MRETIINLVVNFEKKIDTYHSLAGDNLMIKKNNSNSSGAIKVLAQHICMSVFKAQRVIDQIRGRSYEETIMILELMPYRASYPILKLVYSAAANANHNMGLNETDLFISKAEVNGGPFVKKLRPRARGRSYPIKRPTCHITILLKDKSKLSFDKFKI